MHDSRAPWLVAWRRGKPQRGDPFQSPGCVALQGRPNPGFVRAHNHKALQGRPIERPFSTKRPLYPCAVRGEVLRSRRLCSLAGCLAAASAPAGRPFPEPRVRSPARATKPWVRSCPQPRSPAGATHKSTCAAVRCGLLHVSVASGQRA